jgi:hypothetical protein
MALIILFMGNYPQESSILLYTYSGCLPFHVPSSDFQSLIPSTPAAQSHLSTENRLQMLSPSKDIQYQNSPPKKIRRWYMKREAARVRIK